MRAPCNTIGRALAAVAMASVTLGCDQAHGGADIGAASAQQVVGSTAEPIQEGVFQLEAMHFRWTCVDHPAVTKLLVPKDRDHDRSKKRESAKLARELLKELMTHADAPKDIPRVFFEPAIGDRIGAGIIVKQDVGVLRAGERVLLFSAEEFVEQVKRSGTTDAAAFRLAHELAHHRKGHPSIDSDSPQRELEADRYAGYLLGKRGTTLEHATAWVRANAPSQDTPTHPGRSKRLDATTRGWNQGCAESMKCNPG